MTAIPRFGVSAKFISKGDDGVAPVTKNGEKSVPTPVSGGVSPINSKDSGSHESGASGKRMEKRRQFSRPTPHRFPMRVLATLQRLTGRSERSRGAPIRANVMNYRYSNSPGQASFSHSQSFLPPGSLAALGDTSAPLLGCNESLISEVIRDQTQFNFILEANQAEEDPDSLAPGPSHLSTYQMDIRGLLKSYLSALEMAELESRAAGGGHFRPNLRGLASRNRLSVDLSNDSFSRMPSFRDTSRRMRMVPPLVGVYHVNWSGELSEEDSRLGFAHLPDQVHRKAVKKGFNFTLMVVGESGLGKSTLISSLFMKELYGDREFIAAGDRITCTTKIEKRQIELDERGVKLRLTVVDTPGFNDAIDCTNCWRPIEEYIDSTFEQYFQDECGLNRKNIHDYRVHCCLYFISPFGHGLRQVDVEFMHRLQHKVNIVPVIAKADTLTATELHAFKTRVMSDLIRYKIDIYRLPECDSDEEDEIKKLDKEIKNVLPFAVIGSNYTVEVDGNRKIRGRQYPWGVVEVDNGRHCDFNWLRTFLLKTHMQDLKDMTLDVHYENYRAMYITERMKKRQTDRRDIPSLGVAGRTIRDGFEATAGQYSLQQQKDEIRGSIRSKQRNSSHSSTTGSISSVTPSVATTVNNA